jgi:DMSO/TMAO reductase YedYZ molybdopterin-dependent catalytic subunit
MWLSACAPVLPTSATPMTHPEPIGGPSREVAITGAVNTPLRLDATALQALPQVTLTTGGHSYTGALLWPLLQAKAGIHSVQKKNPTVSMYLIAEGTDGYRAILALAEIDPDFGNRPALIAYALDGAPIGKSGALRLIVPSDAKMARSVSNLAVINIQNLSAAHSMP